MPAVESLLRDRPAATSIVVDRIDDVQRFAALGPEWNELVASSRAPNPFLTWDWLYAWAGHLGASQKLQLLTVRTDDRQLIGIAPLCLSRRRWPFISELEFLGTGLAGSDYLDVIARRGFEQVCAGALASWLRDRGDSVRFDHLPPNAIAAAIGAELSRAGWEAERSRSGVCPFARLSGHTWDSYIDALGASQRTRCRRYLNTLRKKFDVVFERVEQDSQRHEALTALMRFHERRWGRRGGSTAFQSDALRAFHHDVTTRALNAGWLRLSALRLNGEIAAVTYCFFLDGRFYLYQHGFNDRFWSLSVGVVALSLTIRGAIEEGAAEFDMLYGDEPYKTLWAGDHRPLERIQLFPPHLRGRFHHRTVDAERTMRQLARRIFPRKPCDTNVRPAGVAS